MKKREAWKLFAGSSLVFNATAFVIKISDEKDNAEHGEKSEPKSYPSGRNEREVLNLVCTFEGEVILFS